MPSFQITRTVALPDPLRLARYRRAPEVGPRVLFFSGGTALRDLSRELIEYTHNSVHLITPFDSGGSSAKLRQAFDMLAVGDMRNRLMALADRSVTGNPAIFELFAHRLPEDESSERLQQRLAQLIEGRDRRMAGVSDPMRKLIRSHLQFFRERMPDGFDLRGASIGNLILAGGFFNFKRHIDPVIYLFSKLVEVRGTVRPVVADNLHLAAELRDGSVVVGQHRLTGKEGRALGSPVKRLFLSRSDHAAEPAETAIRPKIRQLITGAELICFPMGSFYTSLAANLLPKGVGAPSTRRNAPRSTSLMRDRIPNNWAWAWPTVSRFCFPCSVRIAGRLPQGPAAPIRPGGHQKRRLSPSLSGWTGSGTWAWRS